MPTDPLGRIFLPVSDVGVAAAKAGYVSQVILEQSKEIRSHDQ